MGDHLWFIPEDYPTPRYGPRVVAIEPPHHLVCMLGDDSDRPIESWQFILRPCGLGTRLLHRIRSSASRPAGMRAMDALLEPGYFYMSAGMLRGIATRAASEGRELAPVTQPPLATPAGKPLTALVAAASAQGTTREIARTVVAELRAAGIDAIMSDAADVTDVTGYDAVVIGSCIHAHRWLPAAVRMIECHGPVLRERPVWLFSTGMQAIDTGQPWKPHYPEDSDRLTAMTGAREHRIFTGCRSLPEPKALWQVIGKGIVWYAIRRGLAPKGYGMTTGDYRDWDAIRAWARGVAGALRDEATRRAA